MSAIIFSSRSASMNFRTGTRPALTVIPLAVAYTLILISADVFCDIVCMKKVILPDGLIGV
jgi:hypothetical protein